MSSKILPLPESVRSQLRSGITITSVAQCVEELIVDNGHGVSHGDLKYLGTRHATSKCHTLDDLNSNLSHYGFRGEALASIIDMAAIVDITTRPRGSTKTFSKLFTYGKEKSVSNAKTPRPSVGTTLTIQDFMYNMPVRRKLIKEAIDIETIRKRLESFALMHPKVSLNLRNDTNNIVVMQTSKTSCIMSTFMQLFGADKAQTLAEVEHTLDQFTVTGYIGTHPHLTKALQFVYVNKRVILKTKIHKMINALLSKSSIISTRLHPTSTGSGKNPSSPAKGMNLYCIFLINIECPYSEYDICLEPKKTLVEFKDWDKLLICIEEMIIKFIEEENLVISIDERYRRSGKDQEVDDEVSSTVSQSSPSLLQMFSLKRNIEEKNEPGTHTEKYGHTICTQDNLLAVHSLPVKRIKKRHKSSESSDNIDMNEDNAGNSDKVHENINQRINSVNGKNLHHRDAPSKDNFPKPSNSVSKVEMPHTEANKVLIEECTFRGDKNSSDFPISENTGNVLFSSLEEFKNVIADSSVGSDESLSGQDNFRVKPGSVTLVETSVIQRDPERTSDNEGCGNKSSEHLHENFSSLEEFMKFYNADKRKTELESYKTPEQAVLHPPTSPPPLKTTKRFLSTSQDGGGEILSVVRLRSDVKKNNETKSLCKTLSSKWKKHQSKMQKIQTLQNFEYQKTNAVPVHASHTLNKNEHIIQKDSDKYGDNIPSSFSQSQERAEACVSGAVESQEVNCNTNTEDLDISFRFEPVILKKIGEDEIKIKLSDRKDHMEYPGSCNVLPITYNRIKTQNDAHSVERKTICSNSPPEIFHCNMKVDHQGVPERSKALHNYAENYNPFPEIIPIIQVEQPKKNSTLRSEVFSPSNHKVVLGPTPQTRVENDILRQNSEIVDINSRTAVTVGSSRETFSPPESLRHYQYSSVIRPLCKGGSRCREFLEKGTETDPQMSSSSSRLCLRLKIPKTDCEKLMDEVDINGPKRNNKESCMTDRMNIATSTQPFEVEGILENKKSNNLHCEDMQKESGAIQQSQGFILSDLYPGSQNKEMHNSSSCQDKDKSNSVPVQETQGFTPKDLIENFHIEASKTGAHKTFEGILESDPMTVFQKIDSILGDLESTTAGKNGTNTCEESEQVDNVVQNINQVEARGIDTSDTKTAVSSQVLNNSDEDLIQGQNIQFCNKNERTKAQPDLPLLPSGEIQKSTFDVTSSSNSPDMKVISSDNTQSPDPFSESLHISQLTLPEDVAETQQLYQETSNKVTCDMENIGSINMSLSSMSSFSNRMTHKTEKEMPSRKDKECQKECVENSGDGIQCNVNIASLLSSSKKNTQNLESNCVDSLGSDSEFLYKKTGAIGIEELDKTRTVNGQSDDDMTQCSTLDNINKSDEPRDTSSQSEGTLCLGNRWKEVCDKDGKKVYVDLHTGNTSYDPPQLGPAPEWTSSQPLGAPLLKVPLSNEPWYNPVRKGSERRPAFSLSHGFSAFMSWKKTRDLEKNMDLSRKCKTTALDVGSSNSKDNLESNIVLEEGGRHGGESNSNSFVTTKVKEAINSVLKDLEADDDTIKWSNKPPAGLQQDMSEPSEVVQICRLWEAPNFAMDADILTSEALATTAERGAITQKEGGVLGQLDKKFIACNIEYTSHDHHEQRSSQLIVLFDQHAVHERVRLETIIQENYETLDSGESVIRSSIVKPPLEMSLPADEVRLMMAYSEVFSQRGLQFTKISTSKVSFQSIPSCLVAKEASEVRHKRCQTANAIVESIVRDMCHTLHQTTGVVGAMPKPITYVLNSQACRGAVKFGDELTLSQCQELISSLCSCQLPFQCAHGRPSIVPIVNLTHLTRINKKDTKPNLQKLRDMIQDRTTH
ncbi:DNA mismatch repair protein Mlh3-like [Homarus americanus]|uniref:DNA mismatch repair protein Mlh3-like n=1 Tax=Homarus americanus TaxID=6706 RepID=A0A8J5N2L8_HOMAM|nr:DNA mismatch repair protein Mlh3-like [Homarus americanus]